MSPESGTGFLSCRELIEFLHEYLDGDLPADARRRFEAHLAVCPPCRDYLESYRRTVSLTAEAWESCGPDDPIPDEVPEELVRAVLAARPRP
jgi:anti-sigma factor RsiW